MRVDETPLEAVLEAIAAQTDVAITIRGDPGTVARRRSPICRSMPAFGA